MKQLIAILALIAVVFVVAIVAVPIQIKLWYTAFKSRYRAHKQPDWVYYYYKYYLTDMTKKPYVKQTCYEFYRVANDNMFVQSWCKVHDTKLTNEWKWINCEQVDIPVMCEQTTIEFWQQYNLDKTMQRYLNQ